MKPLHLLLLTLISLLPLHAYSAPPDWQGEYAYTASYGATKGGSAISADYVVRLSNGGNAGSCEIEISGFQTYEEIVCTAEPAGNSISLRFKSYKSGEVKNAHGVAVYQPGQVLLVFERAQKNGRSTLLTHWSGITGLDGKKPATGETFKRVKPAP